MGQSFNNKQPVSQPPLLLVPLQQLADLIIKFHVDFPNHSHFPCCHCILFSCLYYWSENSLLPYPQTIPSNPRRDYGHVSHADKVLLRLSHKTLSQRQKDLQQPRSRLRLHDFFLKLKTTPVPTSLSNSIFYWLFFDRDHLCSGFTLERKFCQLISHLLRTSWYQVF